MVKRKEIQKEERREERERNRIREGVCVYINVIDSKHRRLHTLGDNDYRDREGKERKDNNFV